MEIPKRPRPLSARLRLVVRRVLFLGMVLTVTAVALILPSPAAAGTAAPDLTASVTHAAELTGGGYIQFVIVVTNTGSGPTDGSTVTVDMSLSTGLSAYVLSALNWKPSFWPLRCTRADALPPGASYEPIFLYVRAAVPPPPTASITVAVGGGGDSSPGNNTAVDVLSFGRTTSTTLTSDLNPFAFGKPATLTATVASADGSGVPTGTVTFRDGPADLGSAPLTDGRASLAGLVLSVGAHTLTAAYGGDTAFKGSASPSLALEVLRAEGALTVADATGEPGLPTDLMAALTPAAADKVIDFAVGGVSVGRSATDASGRATVSWPIPIGSPPGPSACTASFAGDESIGGATGTATLTVFDVPPTLAPVADQVNIEGQTVSLAVTGHDDNGEALTFAATGLPPGLAIDTAGAIDGPISGTAAAGSPYLVTVTTTDPTPRPSAAGPWPDTYSVTFTWTVSHDDAPPGWPVEPQVTASAVTESALSLTWSPAADNVAVAGYQLYSNAVLAAEAGPTETTHRLTGLTKNTTYTFRVEAGDPAGNWSVDGPKLTVTTALGPPDLTVDPDSGWLQAGQAIMMRFPGQPGVTASYRLTYEQSQDGVAFQPAPPLTGSLTMDDRQVYSAFLVIPPDAGYWRNLALAVKAGDPTGAVWETDLSLGCLVDTVPPVIIDAVAVAARSSGTGVLSIDLEGEPGLMAEAFLSSPDASALVVRESAAEAALTVSLSEDPAAPGHYHGHHDLVDGPQHLQVTARAVDRAGNETQVPVIVQGPGDSRPPAMGHFTLVDPPRLFGGVAYYRFGETIIFQMAFEHRRGNGPGHTPSRVWVTIPGSLAGLPGRSVALTESSPGSGVYRGSYRVGEGDTTAGPLNRWGIVRATATMMDPAGGQYEQVSPFRLAVDTSPPEAADLTAGAPTTHAAAAVLKFTLTEPSHVQVEWSRDGGPWEKGHAQKQAYLPPGRRATAVGLPSPGIYRFRLTLTDRAANTRTIAFPATLSRVMPSPRKPPTIGP